jgi:hypothetical protein
MSPRKSSEPEDPLPLRELEPELDELLRELELDELLRELLPLEREPPLKDWPPPGRANKKVTLAVPGESRAIAAVGAIATTTKMMPATNVRERFREWLMRVARREAR